MKIPRRGGGGWGWGCWWVSRGLPFLLSSFIFQLAQGAEWLRFVSDNDNDHPNANPNSLNTVPSDGNRTHNKLLILMLDGFRWDYLSRQKEELRGFPLFLEEGAEVEWVNPVFPPDSFPGWTTIVTGLWPESHGILGNFMYDLRRNQSFDLHEMWTTSDGEWWTHPEPLWTTATRYNKKTFARFWSRCDIPFDEIIPEECSPYRVNEGVEIIRESLNLAVERLAGDTELAMVYGEHLDNVGHRYGPDSDELLQAMRDVDEILYDFLDRITDIGLDDKLNIVIVSDHGMSGMDGSTVQVHIDSYLGEEDVYRIVGYGGSMGIAPYSKKLESVLAKLKKGVGFDVYRREDIPPKLHYKDHRLVQDILLVAHPGYHLVGSSHPSTQVPRDGNHEKLYGGSHGYDNSTDMRTILYARGPDIKRGVYPPICLVDEYQLFLHLLGLQGVGHGHNGSWTNVNCMLVNAATAPKPISTIPQHPTVFILFISIVIFYFI